MNASTVGGYESAFTHSEEEQDGHQELRSIGQHQLREKAECLFVCSCCSLKGQRLTRAVRNRAIWARGEADSDCIDTTMDIVTGG